MEIIVGFLIFLLFYWNIFVILKQKGDKMVENYLDDIYKPGVNHCFRLWANGKYGSIYDLENNCVLRFIEVPDGTHYKYKEEDWKQKSPILASGIVVWWLLYRRSKSVLDIYESYCQMRMAQYKARREKDADSWKCDIEDEFFNKEWLDIERKCVYESQALFGFVSEQDGKEIQDIINNYWSFIKHTKLLSKVSSHMNSDNLLELEYKILDILSLHGNEIDTSKKNESKQICNYTELRLYTEEEIREASLDMQKKGWIYCFVDDTQDELGPAYWHKLLSPGIIALREFLKNNSRKKEQPTFDECHNVLKTDDDLQTELEPLFYGNKEEVAKYINKMRVIPNNTEKAQFTAELVNHNIISNLSYKKRLWDVLKKYGLYEPSLSNWCNYINKYI
ncbi:hypothetical protein [Segatella sp.]|uniref:hypothetical protein n=1 Tax=Segatella sp. TaxID=2974253 RepID=UPI003AAE7E9A